MSGLLPQTLQDSSDIFSRASGDATRRRSALEASHTGSDNQGTNLRRQKRSGTKRKPSRWILSCYNRCTPLNTVVVTLALVILSWLPWIGLWLFRHAQCYSREAFVSWGEAPIHDAASGIHRVCPKVPYTTLSNEGQSDTLGSDKNRRLTVNSGSWLIRNDPWSHTFLESWWNQTSFVREPGLSLSGDNAAFGNLVARLLDDPEQSPHISIIPKCQLNSFGAFVPEKPHVRRPLERDEPIGATQIKWSTSSISIQQEEWYRSPLFYHAGDFVAHASGMDQKAAGVAMLLARAE